MENNTPRFESKMQPPKFFERFVSFFRTRIGAALSSASLPASGAAVLGSLAAGPVGAGIGALAAGVPFAIGGYDFGQSIENNIYQRPQKALSSWREKLKNIASSVVLKVNQLLENSIVTGTVTGTAAGLATMNPMVGLVSGVAGGVAGAIGGWKFGGTLQQNIRNENNVVSSAYPAMMYASGQTMSFNRGV